MDDLSPPASKDVAAASPPEPRRILGLHWNVFFAGLVSFFMDVSSEMIYPLVPLFLASVLGVNKSVIGLIEGIAEATASLLKVFAGGPQDLLDAELLLAGDGGEGIRSEVEARLPPLPRELQQATRQLLARRRP